MSQWRQDAFMAISPAMSAGFGQEGAAGRRFVEEGGPAMLAVLAVVHQRHGVAHHRLRHRSGAEDEQLDPFRVRLVPER